YAPIQDGSSLPPASSAPTNLHVTAFKAGEHDPTDRIMLRSRTSGERLPPESASPSASPSAPSHAAESASPSPRSAPDAGAPSSSPSHGLEAPGSGSAVADVHPGNAVPLGARVAIAIVVIAPAAGSEAQADAGCNTAPAPS